MFYSAFDWVLSSLFPPSDNFGLYLFLFQYIKATVLLKIIFNGDVYNDRLFSVLPMLYPMTLLCCLLFLF